MVRVGERERCSSSGNRQCKCHEVQMCLEEQQNSKEVSGAGDNRPQGFSSNWGVNPIGSSRRL